MKRHCPNLKIMFFVIFFLGILGLAKSSWAATYYIDYVGGNDSNNGTAQSAAWKHCPGDPDATNIGAATQFTGGDVVYFKGGVRYLGSIALAMPASGTLTLNGMPSGWGTGKAVMDGSDVLGGWTRCQSASECGGNPNYANIYYATLPGSGADRVYQPLYDNINWVNWASSPVLSDPFWYDNMSEYFTATSITNNGTSNTVITDTTRFTASDPDYHNGSVFGVYHQPNDISLVAVKSYDPNSRAVSVDYVGDAIYPDPGQQVYLWLNHLSLMTMPNTYVMDTASNRIYIWPLNGTGNLRLGQRKFAIKVVSGGARLIVDGFKFTGYWGGPGNSPTGGKVCWAANTEVGLNLPLTFQNNEISRTLEYYNSGAAVTGASGSLIQNNSVTDIKGGRGLQAAGKSTIKNNTINRTGYSSIYLAGSNGGVIEGNTVVNNTSQHGNAITVYETGSNAVVKNNKCFNSSRCLAIQNQNSITISNNVFTGRLSSWSPNSGNVVFANNTLLGDLTNIGGVDCSTYSSIKFQNNIIGQVDGCFSGANVTRDHNFYAFLGNEPPNNYWEGVDHVRYGFTVNEGELNITCGTPRADYCQVNDPTLKSTCFVNPGGYDFRLKSDCIAKDAGINLSSYLMTDLDGTSRPQGSGWDIGAYEYVEGGDKTPPGAPTGLSIR